MKLVVIIPTLGRKKQVPLLISQLERQTRLPDEVVLSAPDASHIEPCEQTEFPISLVCGKSGLTVQRNNALVRTLDRFDIITFFDDDFIPADDYLERVVRAFEEHPDRAVVMGHVVKDGVNTPGLSFEEGMSALRAAESERPRQSVVADHVGAYGCNMSIRTSLVGDLRFDERLPLYGWQEDIDFTSQLRRKGRVVCDHAIFGVHLGVKAGRVSGDRFGYSQVANPIYLMKKGSVPPSFLLPLMMRNVAANVVRSIRPEAHVDRRGRLRGNLLALWHVLKGRIEPEYILRIGS